MKTCEHINCKHHIIDSEQCCQCLHNIYCEPDGTENVKDNYDDNTD